MGRGKPPTQQTGKEWPDAGRKSGEPRRALTEATGAPAPNPGVELGPGLGTGWFLTIFRLRTDRTRQPCPEGLWGLMSYNLSSSAWGKLRVQNRKSWGSGPQKQEQRWRRGEDVCMDGCIDGWMDGWMDGWIGKWMGGWVAGRKEGRKGGREGGRKEGK